MSVIPLGLKYGAKSMLTLPITNHPQLHCMLLLKSRKFSTIHLTKNLTLYTNQKAKTVDEVKVDKPLCIIHSWLLAKPKVIKKYADVYLGRDFNVLTVRCSPWQLLWPQSGAQVIASDVLAILANTFTKSPLYLHGFSVGGYVWSESLVQIAAEADKFHPVTSRFVAQVWDSAADINDLPYGFPKAVFPVNPLMENAFRTYILYHLKAFNKVATCHYIRGSQMFHTTVVKCPALFMVSSRDKVGQISSNARVRESWEAQGMTVYWKDWIDSAHVCHFAKYNKEYIALLNDFLDKASDAFQSQYKLQMKI